MPLYHFETIKILIRLVFFYDIDLFVKNDVVNIIYLPFDKWLGKQI